MISATARFLAPTINVLSGQAVIIKASSKAFQPKITVASVVVPAGLATLKIFPPIVSSTAKINVAVGAAGYQASYPNVLIEAIAGNVCRVNLQAFPVTILRTNIIISPKSKSSCYSFSPILTCNLSQIVAKSFSSCKFIPPKLITDVTNNVPLQAFCYVIKRENNLFVIVRSTNSDVITRQTEVEGIPCN